MAEPIGLASGVLTLATFALQSSITLFETVNSFKSHQQRIRDLLGELGALSEVLSSLTETINAIPDIDFSALQIPLQRCGNSCKDFQDELSKCAARSSASRTSFRDWSRLRYMGEDVDGFRRLLAGYKLTINIALTDATLRKSAGTAESIEVYKDLLSTAREDFEVRLQSMDEKLEIILGRSTTVSESDASEMRLIKEERLSTEKSLQICAQLSEHIGQLQLAANRKASGSDDGDSDTIPGKITNESLQECKESLARAAQRLEGYEKQLFGRLMDKSKTAITSEEERAELARLRDEWEATRQGMDIFSRAHDHLRSDVSTIENYATGDAVQYMVSTREKTIHGKNRGLGWRTRQVGGHLSDDSLKYVAQSFSSVAIPSARLDDNTVSVPDEGLQNPTDPKFQQQYGRGFVLKPKTTDSAEAGASRSPKG